MRKQEIRRWTSSVAGWSPACSNDKAHGYLFEQWMEKCRRRWAVFHAA